MHTVHFFSRSMPVMIQLSTKCINNQLLFIGFFTSFSHLSVFICLKSPFTCVEKKILYCNSRPENEKKSTVLFPLKNRFFQSRLSWYWLERLCLRRESGLIPLQSTYLGALGQDTKSWCSPIHIQATTAWRVFYHLPLWFSICSLSFSSGVTLPEKPLGLLSVAWFYFYSFMHWIFILLQPQNCCVLFFFL